MSALKHLPLGVLRDIAAGPDDQLTEDAEAEIARRLATAPICTCDTPHVHPPERRLSAVEQFSLAFANRDDDDDRDEDES